MTRPGETPLDISHLKPRLRHKGTRAEVNKAEARNILKATIKYLARRPTPRKAPFDYAWALRLHREMFGDVWDWGGQIRKHDLNLGLPWQQVEAALYHLLVDLPTWAGYGVGLLEQSVRLHYRAVYIHPFENGNGRWARMLANIWLKRHGHAVTEWPEEVIGGESVERGQYLAAIRAADNGDEAPLLELSRHYTPGA
jgi:Fic-DOC domain mobile mystery protein B